MVQGLNDDVSTDLPRKDAGGTSEPTLYEEKALEKIPAARNKQRRLKNNKTRQTLLRLELQRRRKEGSLRGEKISSLEEVSRSIATSVIRLKPLKKGQSLEKSSLDGNTDITTEQKAGQKYFGLAKHLEDATLIEPRSSYKKDTEDPPEVVLPSGLHFGTPLIINRSQLSHLGNLTSQKERHSVSEGNGTLETSSNESVNISEGELRIGGDISRKNWHWYNKALCRLSRRQYVQLFVVGVIFTLTVVFTLVFAKENDIGIYHGEIGNTVSSPLNERHAPTRPSPALSPVFEENNFLHVEDTTEALDNDDLIKVIQRFTNEDFLKDADAPHRKAYRWVQSNKLGDMDISRVKQRYILALFYFHFEAETWNIEYGWLSSKHECTWYGVRCGIDASDATSRKLSSTDEELAETVTGLDLSENNLHGKLPEDLKYLTNLVQLVLSKNFIQGPIPAGLLLNFQSMHTLYLDKNYITGQLPDEIGHLSLLRNLDLQDNSLRGTIPATINILTDLVDVRLQNNEFYGDIPDVFGAMTNLRIFLAGNNEIESIIPASLATCPHLEALHLHENELYGSIPVFISAELKQLHLDDNSFDGSIPVLVAPSSSALEELRLGNNKISGEISSALGDQTSLTILQLQGNKLTGSVPDSICLLKTEHKLKHLTVVCMGSDQKISCECCDFC